MSIPETVDLHKPEKPLFQRVFGDWILVGIVLMTGSLCFGIGSLANKENSHSGDNLWIEQLPASELPGSVATTSSAAQQAFQKEEPAAPSGAAAAALAPTTNPSGISTLHTAATGIYVASKTGKKYYLTSCATAKRIKDINRVYFPTKAQAEGAGYKPTTNCKGM